MLHTAADAHTALVLVKMTALGRQRSSCATASCHWRPCRFVWWGGTWTCKNRPNKMRNTWFFERDVQKTWKTIIYSKFWCYIIPICFYPKLLNGNMTPILKRFFEKPVHKQRCWHWWCRDQRGGPLKHLRLQRRCMRFGAEQLLGILLRKLQGFTLHPIS